MPVRPLMHPGSGEVGPGDGVGVAVGMFSQPRQSPPSTLASLGPLLRAKHEPQDNSGCQRATWLPTRMAHCEDMFIFCLIYSIILYYFLI